MSRHHSKFIASGGLRHFGQKMGFRSLAGKLYLPSNEPAPTGATGGEANTTASDSKLPTAVAPTAAGQFRPTRAKPRSALRTMKSTKTPVDRIERAPKGCCQYLYREDGKQKECGSPGVYVGRGKPHLVYCQMHAEHVRRFFEVIAIKADADGRRQVLKPFKL